MDPIHRPKSFNLSHSIPQSEDTGMKQYTGATRKRKPTKSYENDSKSVENLSIDT